MPLVSFARQITHYAAEKLEISTNKPLKMAIQRRLGTRGLAAAEI
jgi:hypothetical protein